MSWPAHYLTLIIRDHEHIVRRIGNGSFFSTQCAECGRANNRHYSHGVKMAELLGGQPEDYLPKETT